MEKVKGMCESCGFAYKGNLAVPYPEIKCPKCGEVTCNFDEANAVDEVNRANSHEAIDYKESELAVA